MIKVLNGPEVAAKMSAALKDIARLTGFSQKVVTKGEAGAILKTWAGRTKVAKADAIDNRTRRRTMRNLGLTSTESVGDITVNSGRNRRAFGQMWVKTQGTTRLVNGAVKTYRPWRVAGQFDMNGQTFTPGAGGYATGPKQVHWKDDTWAAIMATASAVKLALGKQIPLQRQSAGLARQSVIQIADSAGIRLESVPGGSLSAAGIAKARKAIASDGRRYTNGTSLEKHEHESGRYIITLINSLPYHAKAGLDQTLAGVLAGRVGLFRRTFQTAAYKGVNSAAKNYPWIRARLAA